MKPGPPLKTIHDSVLCQSIALLYRIYKNNVINKVHTQKYFALSSPFKPISESLEIFLVNSHFKGIYTEED